MSEQQIDAELCRYEPFMLWGDAWTWFIWAPHFGTSRRPEDVLLSDHRKLTRRGANYYPTREAAFADLRRAIAARGTNAGS